MARKKKIASAAKPIFSAPTAKKMVPAPALATTTKYKYEAAAAPVAKIASAAGPNAIGDPYGYRTRAPAAKPTYSAPTTPTAKKKIGAPATEATGRVASGTAGARTARPISGTSTTTRLASGTRTGVAREASTGGTGSAPTAKKKAG